MKTRSLIKSILIALIFIAMQAPYAKAQHVDSIQMAVIRGLSNYRTELLKRHPEDLGHIVKLLAIMKMQIPVEDAYNGFLYAMEELSLRDSAFIVKEITTTSKKYAFASFLKEFTHEDFQAISRNLEILFLLRDELMDLEYPFKLQDPRYLSSSLAFYQIHAGHTIGELGAGNGMTSLLFGVIYDSLTIYINEIDQKSLTRAEGTFRSCQSLKPGIVYLPVLGQNYTTGLEGRQLDRVIARHSFHHFTRVKDMLVSIRKSLAPGGLVILEEPDAALRQQDYWMCQLAKKKNKIVKIWQKHGFRLVEEKRADTTVFLKFAPD